MDTENKEDDLFSIDFNSISDDTIEISDIMKDTKEEVSDIVLTDDEGEETPVNETTTDSDEEKEEKEEKKKDKEEIAKIDINDGDSTSSRTGFFTKF